MEPAQIATIKLLHRPSVHWRRCVVIFGCSCGADTHPCEVLAAALEAEREAADAAHHRGTPRNAGHFGS